MYKESERATHRQKDVCSNTNIEYINRESREKERDCVLPFICISTLHKIQTSLSMRDRDREREEENRLSSVRTLYNHYHYIIFCVSHLVNS